MPIKQEKQNLVRKFLTLNSFLIIFSGFAGGLYGSSSAGLRGMGVGYILGLYAGFLFISYINKKQHKGFWLIFNGTFLGLLIGCITGLIAALTAFFFEPMPRVHPIGGALFGGFIGGFLGLKLGFLFSLIIFISRQSIKYFAGRPIVFLRIPLFLLIIIGQFYYLGITAKRLNKSNLKRGFAQAIAADNVRLVRTLLDRDNNFLDNSRKTAIAGVHSKEMLDLLLNYGVGIDEYCLGEYGIRYQHLFYDILLSRGALIDCPGDKGETALHEAASRNNTSDVQYLISHGANIDAIDHDGNTPLHWASHWAVDTARILIEKGASINALNFKDKTPLDIAEDYSLDNSRLINLLLQYNAKKGKELVK